MAKFVVLILSFALGFTLHQDVNAPFTPPGTERVGDNQYRDKDRVSNLSYVEYLFWLGKQIQDVQAYKNALPDSSYYYANSEKRDVSYDYYLRGPKHRNDPVIGVSPEQAKAFSKWRSDRVFQLYLIKQDVIKWDEHPTKDSYFSIEKFCKDQYQSPAHDSKYNVYPVYTLENSNTESGFRNLCHFEEWK